MIHIYKCEEWQSPTGQWLCGDVSAPAANSNTWWYPANILGISVEEYVKILVSKYHAVDLRYETKYDVLIFRFNSLADCRKYKNDINKKAREIKFYTY